MELPNRVVRLLLEGQVTGPWVEQLRRSCEETLRQRAQVILDLTDVSFIDADGIALLKAFGDRGVTVTDPSPFVTELLKGSRS